MRDRFDRLEAMLEVQASALGAQSRAIAFLLASVTQQPAMVTGLQELLNALGREMPGNVLPVSGSVLSS